VVGVEGDQRDYFKKNGFAVIEWKDAEVILTNKNLKGGKQYHTGWLTIITADGPKYLSIGSSNATLLSMSDKKRYVNYMGLHVDLGQAIPMARHTR
jgi:hypothetical protein